jgi:hypothetical protein
MELCNENILDMNKAINLKLTEGLTYLAYKTSKNNMIEAVRKEHEQQSKYKR